MKGYGNDVKLFYYLFPKQRSYYCVNANSPKDGTGRIFAYHLMPCHNLNPHRVAPVWDLCRTLCRQLQRRGMTSNFQDYNRPAWLSAILVIRIALHETFSPVQKIISWRFRWQRLAWQKKFGISISKREEKSQQEIHLPRD